MLMLMYFVSLRHFHKCITFKIPDFKTSSYLLGKSMTPSKYGFQLGGSNQVKDCNICIISAVNRAIGVKHTHICQFTHLGATLTPIKLHHRSRLELNKFRGSMPRTSQSIVYLRANQKKNCINVSGWIMIFSGQTMQVTRTRNRRMYDVSKATV